MRFGPQPGAFRPRGKSARTKELFDRIASFRTILNRRNIRRFSYIESIAVVVFFTFCTAAIADGRLIPFQSEPQSDTLAAVAVVESLASPEAVALDSLGSEEPESASPGSPGATGTSSPVEMPQGQPLPSLEATANTPTDGSASRNNAPEAEASASGADSRAVASRPSPPARSSRQDDGEVAPPQKAPSVEEKFIALITEPAQASQRETGVPASVTIAQAMLESDWGRSRLSREANNYFGIKALRKPGTAGVVYADTWESLNGRDVILKEPFRAYHNMVESFVDHALYFVENARYAAAMKNVGDARLFARLIHQAGYATDPKYSDKLIALMDKFNLYAYDLKP